MEPTEHLAVLSWMRSLRSPLRACLGSGVARVPGSAEHLPARAPRRAQLLRGTGTAQRHLRASVAAHRARQGRSPWGAETSCRQTSVTPRQPQFWGQGVFPGRRGEQKGAGGAEVKHMSSSESFSRDPASAKVNTFNTFCTRYASH